MPGSLVKATSRLASALPLCVVLTSATPAFAATPEDTTVVRPFARAETDPVPHRRDAADTPDIWVHPTLPESSLVIATDKRGGLMVYDLDGHQRQLASDGVCPNDVNVLYGFPLAGENVDLALAGCRSTLGMGVKVWAIDPHADTLRDVTAGGFIAVFGGGVPYGTCVYRSPRDGRSYFFVTNKQGRVEQYALVDAGNGTITGSRVRAFSVGSICEGCVADNELGTYFLSEERVGIWKFGAEPDAGSRRTLVAKVGEHGLQADVEGLTLYYATGGRGYLIASSQGNDVFNVYDRTGENAYLLTIDPQAGAIGDVEHTDGIAVTSCATSRRFPQGLFIAHDGNNDGQHQNFKLYGWEDIAQSRLLVDTGWSPRASVPVPVAFAPERVQWAGSSDPLLATQSARIAPPGALRLEVGFEREAALRRNESNVPFALDVAASRRLELVIEPILYSRIRDAGRTVATGLGDVRVEAIVGSPHGAPRRADVAVAGGVKIPTARSGPIGSGRMDYTGDLIVSSRLASTAFHLNLGYTLVGRPPGLPARDVYSFSLAAERELGRMDLLAELAGHTLAIADGSDTESPHGPASALADVRGEALIGTLGGRYRWGDRAVFSLGISYDDDRGWHVRPGLGLKLR